MKSKTCYARGKIQYFFTIMFGLIFLIDSTMPLWGKVEISSDDILIFMLINIVFLVAFLYFVLLCIFFKVSVNQNKIYYTSILNKSVSINASEIKDIDPIAGRGMAIKLKGKKIVMYSFYRNYYEVRDDILKLMAEK